MKSTYRVTRPGERHGPALERQHPDPARRPLLTYRINAGPVHYTGYTDRLQQADFIRLEGERSFFTDELRRTDRVLFVKFQYLLRY